MAHNMILFIPSIFSEQLPWWWWSTESCCGILRAVSIVWTAVVAVGKLATTSPPLPDSTWCLMTYLICHETSCLRLIPMRQVNELFKKNWSMYCCGMVKCFFFAHVCACGTGSILFSCEQLSLGFQVCCVCGVCVCACACVCVFVCVVCVVCAFVWDMTGPWYLLCRF